MATKLTKKQKVFVEEYAETGNGTQSALKAYDTDSPKVASVIAVENLAKPSIKEALEEALPDSMLLEVHREGLYATKPIYVEGKRVDEDADFTVRAKYLDMGYKLKGSYAAEKHLNLNVELDLPPEIQELAHELLSHQRTTEASN